MTGALYIVATPIGNLEDMTFRAVRTLKEADLIACEDTRQTRILLEHFEIRSKMLTSFFEHNEARKIPEVLVLLGQGKQVAVVSDAGTPTISDPAFRLVREVRRAGYPVIAVPGASAVVAALSVSGLPTDAFVFEGFLPLKKGRKSRLERLESEDRTIVLYESPHRLLKTLAEIDGVFGDRSIVVARELTKKFEEILHGTAADLKLHFDKHAPRGEFVVLIAGKSYSEKLRKQGITIDITR